jgi:hypothetical protein
MILSCWIYPCKLRKLRIITDPNFKVNKKDILIGQHIAGELCPVHTTEFNTSEILVSTTHTSLKAVEVQITNSTSISEFQ